MKMNKGCAIYSIVLLVSFGCLVECQDNLQDIYKDCGSKTGSIVSLTITDCTSAPCKFERGNNYTMNLQFKSNVVSNKVDNFVYGIIAKVPVPFHLPNANGCTLGVSCPIKADSTNSESVTLPILTEYPKISLFVEWKVQDDKGNNLVCFTFPVQLE